MKATPKQKVRGPAQQGMKKIPQKYLVRGTVSMSSGCSCIMAGKT